MLSPVRRAVAAFVLATIAASFCSGIVRAAVASRPNALDRRVTAIAGASLLAQPATQLADPERQDAAERLVNWILPGWFATAIFQAAALAYFWRSGAAARLRDRLRRRISSEPAVRFIFGAALGLIARLAALPAAFYHYRVERIMGLSIDLTRAWGVFWFGHTLLAMLVAGTIAAVVLWLVDRTHQWYLYTIVAIVVVSVAWAYVEPYVAIPSVASPLTGPIADDLHALLVREGYPQTPVYAGSTAPTAGVVLQGTGSMRRVLVPAPFLAGNTTGETEYAVAFQLSADLAKDPLWTALIEAAIVVVGAALAVVIADRVGFRRDDDALSRLALAGALMAGIYIFAVPLRNVAIRSFDMRDDANAVAMTGDRASAVRALVRQTDQEMIEVCPDIMARTFLDLHPGPGERVAAINGVKNGCP